MFSNWRQVVAGSAVAIVIILVAGSFLQALA